MDLNFIYTLISNPLTATTIASLALVVSLYIVYVQIRLYKKLASPRKVLQKTRISPKPKVRRRKKISFGMLNFISKDIQILTLIFVIAGGLYFFSVIFKDDVLSSELVYLSESMEATVFTSLNDEGRLFQIAEDALSIEAASSTSTCVGGYNPVCGLNNQTYWNSCFAQEDEVEIVYGDSCNVEEKEESEPEEVIQAPQKSTIAPVSIPEPEPEPVIVEESTPEVVPEITVASGPAPDLIPVLSHFGSLLVEGDTMSFAVIVKNIGEENLQVPFNTQLFFDKHNDGVIELAFSKLGTRSLEAGAQETKIWKNVWIQKSGTHRAEVCTDIDNVVLETNESNNCESLLITIKEDEITGDLVTENLTITPSLPRVGENVSFSSYIRNKESPRTLTSYAHLKVDGKLVAKRRISGLESGEREKAEWKTIWKATVGDHSYEVCADSNGDVFETNENNNCVLGTMSVPSE